MKQNRKTSFIIVRVTQEEKNKFVNLASKFSQNLSEYVRKILGLDQ